LGAAQAQAETFGSAEDEVARLLAPRRAWGRAQHDGEVGASVGSRRRDQVEAYGLAGDERLRQRQRRRGGVGDMTNGGGVGRREARRDRLDLERQDGAVEAPCVVAQVEAQDELLAGGG